MTDFEKKDAKNQEEVTLDYNDILQIASGIDEDGNPNASAIIAIDEIESEDQISQIINAAFEKAVIDIFANGGCVVVQADFAAESRFAYERAITVASQWMENMDSEDYKNRLLSLVVVPMPLGGAIYLVFRGLVYFMATDIDRQTSRLVLCFDNAMTQIISDEDIDINEVSELIQLELAQQEKEVDLEYMAAQEEYEKAKQEAEYQEFVNTVVSANEQPEYESPFKKSAQAKKDSAKEGDDGEEDV